MLFSPLFTQTQQNDKKKKKPRPRVPRGMETAELASAAAKEKHNKNEHKR